jgi:antitoxin (DNA-binding transcriptional repressor) of toxin-antitoxin stability system
MAITHISQAEAASNFTDLISRVRAGEEVHIDEDVTTVAKLSAPNGYNGPRLLSDIMAGFSCDRSSEPTDPHFASDVQAGMRGFAYERLIDPWESF